MSPIPYELLISIALYIISVRMLSRETIGPKSAALIVTFALVANNIITGLILSSVYPVPLWENLILPNLIISITLLLALWNIFKTMQKNTNDLALWVVLVIAGLVATLAIPAAIPSILLRLGL